MSLVWHVLCNSIFLQDRWKQKIECQYIWKEDNEHDEETQTQT